MKQVREFTLPAYLLACIVLGGSSQAIWGALALQLMAIAILAWAVVERGPKLVGSERMLFLFSFLLLALFLLQLIPLPPNLWSRLGGRALITNGYRTLGQSPPWLPLSVAPYDTLTTSLTLLPPLAVIAAVLKLRAYRTEWCAAAILVGTLGAVLLGFVQVTIGKSGDASWYIYAETNVGSAVGFFANRNHMGTLLLIAVAFIPPLFFIPSNSRGSNIVALRIMGASALLVLLLGIAMNGSLAAVLLSVPVLFASASALPAFGRARRLLASLAGVALIAATIFLAASPVQPKVTGETFASIEGRQEIWKLARRVIQQTFPTGSGFGSFEKLYASAEPPTSVDPTYVNHAHNDYLEVALEGGIAAVLLAGAFVLWWLTRAWKIIASPHLNPFEFVATIASGAILAHSLVDYPLRTSAVAAIFAFCVSLMGVSARRHSQSGFGAAESRRLPPA